MINNLNNDSLSLVFRELLRHEKALCRTVCKCWSKVIKPKTGILLEHYIENNKLFRWAYYGGVDDECNACGLAALFGDKEILEHYSNKNKGFDPYTMANAIKYGDINILNWLSERKCEWYDKDCCKELARKNINLIVWAKNKKYPFSETMLDYALQASNIHILNWMFDRGDWVMRDIIPCLVSGTGNTKSMNWVKKRGGVFHKGCYDWASEYGQLDAIKWLKRNKIPWSSSVISSLALIGHLDGIKWAKENGAPWDAFAFTQAVEGNHLHVIKYLHENGCPWSSFAGVSARGSENKEISDYAKQHCTNRDI